ncbi:Two-component response regulator-like [Quillaja saponaria]|uniref:Two-component response regulator-like n=1 Tax=Quillaja saponaria TaxID=32244 RepID=A0AAD7LJQ6_QUISA|nr:Two-component response regulator-like [Quillaja saponaria]
MGEVVLSSEEMEVMEGEMELEDDKAEEGGGTQRNGGESTGVVRWEKFLPRMRMRVLLVEADDSTRQIISALLRKCSYRVAAVQDGLKAWEILKGRPHDIDLILTEVDLPSISGFALLTLIREHEICKNIPIIMMSSQDSVNIVYKCMLRGAADYLVKPIRKNELRNLWQHVWRRLSSTIGSNGTQDESDAQQKIEATAENNAPNTHSSGDMESIQRNKELIEKGSDAQSSSTKPELEVESAPVENLQDFSNFKRGKSNMSDTEVKADKTHVHLSQTLIFDESHAGDEAHVKNFDAGHHKRGANTTSEACGNDDVLLSSSKEAIDLGGEFHMYPNFSHRSPSNNGTGKFDTSPQLDLSLRGSYPSSFENEVTEDRPTLTHSNASAFKRYTSRQLKSPPTAFTNYCDQQKAYRTTNSEQNISNFPTGYKSDSSTMQRINISPAAVQSKESEIATSHSQQRLFPIPVPVKGTRVNDLGLAYGSVLPPIFCTQSGPVTVRPEPAFQTNTFYQSCIEAYNSKQLYEPHGQNVNSDTNQNMHRQEHKLECLEDRGQISPVTDQSACSSFCNGAVNHLNGIGYGSNCGSNSNIEQAAAVRTTSESKNEDFGSSNRSVQREAALTKFRLKRKERCYDKKVRYESRKKLAEQRPRMKGQFVRQVHSDVQSVKRDGNTYDG